MPTGLKSRTVGYVTQFGEEENEESFPKTLFCGQKLSAILPIAKMMQ
jgi:hypothetical protein